MHESGTPGGMGPVVSSVLAVFTAKEPQRSGPDGPCRRGINISGVDFWHAVEFSRNGRFLRTGPRGLSSGRFPSVLRFRLYQIFPIRFPRGFRLPGFPLSRFPFPAAPTLSEVSRRTCRPSFSDLSGGASSKSEVSRSSQILTVATAGQSPAPSNRSNLPPRSVRVNGSCGAKRRLAAERSSTHIRPPSARRRCVRPSPGRRSHRPGPRVRPRRRRRPGRPAPRRLRW